MGDGAIPACIAGGIPACLAAGLQGRVVSQHALQISRPTPKGEVYGDLCRGVSRSTPKGDLSGGVPAPRGGCSQGVPAPRWEGGLVWPSVVVFCYGLLLWPSGLVAFRLKVAFWYGFFGGGGQKVTTPEGHHTRRP